MGCPGPRSARATCSLALMTLRSVCGTSRVPPPATGCAGGRRGGGRWRSRGAGTAAARPLSPAPACPRSHPHPCTPTHPIPCPLQQLAALHIFQGHLGVVEDVAWHPRHADLFGSVGDDRKLVLWDLRKPSGAAQDKEVEAHTGGWGRWGGWWGRRAAKQGGRGGRRQPVCFATRPHPCPAHPPPRPPAPQLR